MMQIRVNGEVREITSAMNVAGLVAALGLDGRKIAIEKNREIVPKSAYGETSLQTGDEIEIVAFIGGG